MAREKVIAVRYVVRCASMAVALVAVLGGLLTGCGSGPSHVGAAAIVGDRVVPLERIQGQFGAVLPRLPAKQRQALEQGRELDELSRELVTVAVQHELLSVAAAREGIVVTDEQVARGRNQPGGMAQAFQGLLPPELLTELARDEQIAMELGRRALAGLAVTVDYAAVTSRRDAFDLARQLAADPAGARALIRQRRDSGAETTIDARLVAAENPELATSAAFGVPEGTAVAFPADRSGSQWLVMLVRSRSTSGPPAGTAVPDPEPAVLSAIGVRQLAPLADELGVQVSPRYGIWDTMGMRVVANQNETRGLAVPARPAAP